VSDVRDRLVECFTIAFPDRPPETIPAASRDDDEWDSLAMVTLTALIEEEFDIVVTPDNLSSFIAFRSALAYLEAEVGASGV
jgi:acyl carrier protein